MPSIFNHDHACWGVKRSCYNFFNNDYNEDLQDRKSTNFGDTPNSNNANTGTNPVQYSVSANGYYGFQPHIHDNSNVNHAMDIEETVDISRSTTISISDSGMKDCNVLSSNNHHMRRKRHFHEDFSDNFKRMRQEDAMVTEQVPSVHESHQFGGGSRMKHRRWPNCLDMHDFSNENLAQLLRQTHGCEFYHYERNCDF